jgi:hypothetical protein
MSIYSRDFRNNSIRIKNRLKISRFIPSQLKNLIEKNVPDQNYILGVTYKTGDSQICISGHPKVNEDLQTGSKRELLEELSLVSDKMLFCFTDNVNHFCFIDIKETKMSINDKKNDLKDLKDRAVICVHGEEKDILYYLANVKYNLNNEDNIDCIWSSSKNIILKYLETKDSFMTSY